MLTKNGNIACDYCGQFIGVDELIEQKASHTLLTPDSDRSKEEYESYHHTCLKQAKHGPAVIVDETKYMEFDDPGSAG